MEMDKIDRGKLKVLIKMILLQKKGRYLTAKQICNIINDESWGFRSSITSPMVSRLLREELKRKDNHFLDCIDSRKWRSGVVYTIK